MYGTTLWKVGSIGESVTTGVHTESAPIFDSSRSTGNEQVDSARGSIGVLSEYGLPVRGPHHATRFHVNIVVHRAWNVLKNKALNVRA